ncbi:MAG TPA: Holliday junction branch migration protein RuvA [Deltaproteobacteria bacterium]|nr:Holliday junction branch migration protein RuvA [Deltaproteobacteria bacterium]
MIALLTGKVLEKSPQSVVIDVGGVGYEVIIPLSTYYELPDPEGTVTLKTQAYMKDERIELYGFLSAEEKRIFQLLLGVSGVGPRLARNILSGISTEAFLDSLASRNAERLRRIPGVGAKTAERLVLELKDKAAELRAESAGGGEAPAEGVEVDAVSALVNLGYKAAQAEKAVKKASDAAPGADFEGLFKEALRLLAS